MHLWQRLVEIIIPFLKQWIPPSMWPRTRPSRRIEIQLEFPGLTKK
jgi:hypothetical protein